MFCDTPGGRAPQKSKSYRLRFPLRGIKSAGHLGTQTTSASHIIPKGNSAFVEREVPLTPASPIPMRTRIPNLLPAASHGCVAQKKKKYQNGTLVSGNMDQNLRNPSCLILSHTQIELPLTPRWKKSMRNSLALAAFWIWSPPKHMPKPLGADLSAVVLFKNRIHVPRVFGGSPERFGSRERMEMEVTPFENPPAFLTAPLIITL